MLLVNCHDLIKTIFFNKLNVQTTKKIVEAIDIDFSYDAMDEQLRKMIQKMEFCCTQEERQEKPKRQENCINVNSAVLPSPPFRGCNFCDEQHPAFKCLTYVTVSQQREKLKEKYRCLRCGRSGHFVKECHARLTCYKCQGKHWAALCPKPSNIGHSQYKSSIQPTVDAAKKQPSSNVQRTTTSTQFKPTVEKAKENTPKSKERPIPAWVSKCQVKREDMKEGVALPTALINIHPPYQDETKRPVRAFFDSGSQ